MRGRRALRRVTRAPRQRLRALVASEVAAAQPPLQTLPSPPTMVELLADPVGMSASVVSSPEEDDLAFPPFGSRVEPGSDPPLPPSHRWTVAEEFLESGRRDADRLVEVISDAGLELGAGTRVLDFGCGPGRVIRWLPREVDGWGIDIDADRIAWCQSALSPPFRFATCSLHPHLPFADASFDLVYAGSVFTHLSEMADAWLLELRRVTRPGGLLYLTVHDQATVAWCRALDTESPFRALTGWQPPPEREERFRAWSDRLGQDLDGFTIGRAYLAQVFYDREALVGHWGRYAEVVAVVPEAFGVHQTAVVLRAPPAC